MVEVGLVTAGAIEWRGQGAAFPGWVLSRRQAVMEKRDQDLWIGRGGIALDEDKRDSEYGVDAGFWSELCSFGDFR